jgi:GT2 family glycosyltransferase
MSGVARTGDASAPLTPAETAGAPAPGTQSRAVSVIMATYNRGPLLVRLLRQIATQDFPMSELEVVVVDDGSEQPAASLLEPLKRELPYPLTVLTQQNAGAAAARQSAAMNATGELLLILDDDMQIEPWFVSAHVRIHRESPARTCVMGRYASDPDIASKPLFERYYANMWDKLTESVRNGRMLVTGTILSTGNASMRREDFLAVGGFDMTLKQAEDTELGLKLERSGVRMVFSETAYTLHGSDHTRLAKWLGRNYGYGLYDTRIARRHEWAAHADPWRYYFSLPKLGLPFITASILSPSVSKRVSGLVMAAALSVDKFGLEKLALRGAGLVFGMEYFRGVRDESGSLRAALISLASFLAKAADAPRPLPGVPHLLARIAKALHR